MDTGDTGRDTGQDDSSFEVISAAELAGEVGGFSCQQISGVKPDTWAIFLGLAFGLLVAWRRKC